MRKIISTVNKNISIKIFLIFVSIISPLFLISMQINARAITDVQMRIEQSLQLQNETIAYDIEAEINRLNEMQYHFLTGKSLREIMVAAEFLSPWEQYNSLNNIRSDLAAIQNSSKYIQDIRVYVKSMQKVISANDGVNDLDADEFARFLKELDQIDSAVIFWNDAILMPMYFPVVGNSVLDVPGLIEVELSQRNIKKSIENMTLAQNADGILYHMGQGVIAATCDDELASSWEKKLGLAESEPVVDKETGTINVNGETYIYAYSQVGVLGAALVTFASMDKLGGALANYYYYFGVLALILLVIVVVYFCVIRHVLQRPLHTILDAFNKVNNGDIHVRIEENDSSEFSYIYSSFNAMMVKMRALISQIYEQELLSKGMELKHLQAQINPHFLYNCFFSITQMARMNDTDSIKEFTQYLGSYYQFITRNLSRHVPLSEEIDHVINYINIQKFRFFDSISVEIEDLPKSMRNVYVPPLIVQPIIENSFEHGLKNKAQNGVMKMYYIVTDEQKTIVVEDNGEELTEEQLWLLQNKLRYIQYEPDATGILNVHRRLQLTFGAACGLCISRSSMGGMKVEIIIESTSKDYRKEDMICF